MPDSVRVPLPGKRDYWIHLGSVRELCAVLSPFLENRTFMTVADTNTAKYAASFGLENPVVIPAGESSKTFAAAAELCGEAARRGLNRRSVIVAVGGGVTGDLAGFAAAIYMRGIGIIQIPTSLLAMVDSSVGGKTAVDLPEGKNLAGAFLQPETVLIAPEVLKTLPRRERIGALAEVVKYGAALDGEFFTFLESRAGELTRESPDEKLFSDIIRRSCEIKAAVVAADERESGLRKILNYGHTFGHAAEHLSRFALSHGEAVAIGMAAAGRLAVRTGLWLEEEERRQTSLLLKLGLPCRFPANLSSGELLNVMKHDKKNGSGAVTMVLPDRLGHARCVPFGDERLLKSVAEELR